VQVVELGATNRPDLMEPALLRAGRFDYVLELPLPGLEERLEILRIQTSGLPLGDDVDLDGLAAATEGWTGAGLELLCKKAALEALEQCRAAASAKLLVSHRHLWEAASSSS
jgi:transitional endoplasmic reticulum ATPase